jgi:hypothetical protein
MISITSRLKRLAYAPPDQYLRYAAISRVLHGNVLELGSSTENRIAQWTDVASLIRTDVTVSGAVDVSASGTAIPFRDRSFDTVVAVDVLEHIPADDRRDQFLVEARRVARHRVVLTFPAGPGAHLQDRWLHEVARQRGLSSIAAFACEHLTSPLPDPSEVMQTFLNEGWVVSCEWSTPLRGRRLLLHLILRGGSPGRYIYALMGKPYWFLIRRSPDAARPCYRVVLSASRPSCAE